MKLLDYPARASFRCLCGHDLSFSAFDRPGDRVEISCPACGRVWEQHLRVEGGDRGWHRALLKGPAAALPAARRRSGDPSAPAARKHKEPGPRPPQT